MNKILSKQKRVRRKRKQSNFSYSMACEILGSVVVMAGITLLTFLMLFL